MDKIHTFLCISFLTISNSALFSQKAYINSQDTIYELNSDISTCSFTPINNPCGPGRQFQNMAVFRDTLYFSSSDELFRFTLGQPGSCQNLGRYGSGNAMTVDKNGILYMAGSKLIRYNPHTSQLDDLGILPIQSSGDLIFFKNKLLLAGVNTTSRDTGIFEININDLGSSDLYMRTPGYRFFGLISFPVSCGTTKFYGLSPPGNGTTALVELDLINKTVLANNCTLPVLIFDAASGTEIGYDDGEITSIDISPPCSSSHTGSVNVAAFFVTPGTVIYQLDQTITNNTGEFFGVTTGPHTITAISSQGCTINKNFTVFPVSNLKISIQKTDPDDCKTNNGSIRLTSDSTAPSTTYTLLNTGTSQSTGNFTNLGGGTYYFHISNSNDCTKDTSVQLIEKSRSNCADIFVPSAFTPNNDGKNDVFSPIYSPFIKNITMQIFDRWGQKIFEGSGPRVSWDGTYKGIQQPSDVFVYIIRYGYNDTELKSLKGTVFLTR